MRYLKFLSIPLLGFYFWKSSSFEIFNAGKLALILGGLFLLWIPEHWLYPIMRALFSRRSSGVGIWSQELFDHQFGTNWNALYRFFLDIVGWTLLLIPAVLKLLLYYEFAS